MLAPTYRFCRVTDIAPALFVKENIRGLVIDVDNTLCTYRATEIPKKNKAWLSEVLAQGTKICLVSNGGSARVKVIAHDVGLPFLARAGKPSKKAYIQAAELMEVPLASLAAIGDQLFTDIWGAVRLHLPSFLVDPIDRSNEAQLVKIKRPFENLFLGKVPFDH